MFVMNVLLDFIFITNSTSVPPSTLQILNFQFYSPLSSEHTECEPAVLLWHIAYFH